MHGIICCILHGNFFSNRDLFIKNMKIFIENFSKDIKLNLNHVSIFNLKPMNYLMK